MRQDGPLVTTIKLDNGNMYDFSLSAFRGSVYPYDAICIRSHQFKDDIIFIFDIDILIGGMINDVKVEYKADRYIG